MSGATTYRTVVAHARKAPLRSQFRYRTQAWLIDLDRVPQLPAGLRWLARFAASDHLGEPTQSLRANVVALLATNNISIDSGRIVLLANARALGRAFNPISVYWCYAPTGELAAVVAEVHNTYGDRHAYVLRPGPDGRVDERVTKQMYVSPFNAVDGAYRITITEPGERVSVSVTLERDGHLPFVATLRGERQPSGSVVRAALVTAATSWRVSTLIRWQGIRLYLRGLRVQPRPLHARQEAV